MTSAAGAPAPTPAALERTLGRDPAFCHRERTLEKLLSISTRSNARRQLDRRVRPLFVGPLYDQDGVDEQYTRR